MDLSERIQELYDANRNCSFSDAPRHEVEFYAKMLAIFQATMETVPMNIYDAIHDAISESDYRENSMKEDSYEF